MMRTAVIGIGSNSLRMLVAEVEHGDLKRIGRYREGLRVFAALDERGNITDKMMEKACESVESFRKQAMAQGAQTVHLFATSAVRDANNQAAFVEAIRKATGLDVDVCSGDMEAALSFWGAAGEEPCGLIDIGGGSTELAVGFARDIDHAVSLQMGAVRLYRLKPICSISDAEAVVQMAFEILQPVQKDFLAWGSREWIGVGGTFTTGAALVQRVPWQKREKLDGFVLTQQTVQQAMEFLAPLPLEERMKLDFLQPQRADIVVHGVAILLACMRGLNIPHITVSECGNLEGYLKDLNCQVKCNS